MKLELHDLHARHPAQSATASNTLRGLNLRVQAGEAVAVIGPSGAGKTTLLNVLGCALPPQAGGLRLEGEDPWTLPPRRLRALRRRLFIAPQTPPLPPRQRVVTAVLAAALPQWGLLKSLASLFSPRDADLAEAALARFELADKLWERVDRLSGGERQRVGLARALVSDARLWLIDEPLSALDPTRADSALRVLVSEARQRGVTLVASLHHVELALAAFPRIVGLRDGSVQFDLPAAEVGAAQLAALYAQHEQELAYPVASPEAPAAPLPVPMTCR
jgi:phosphonate transport system ATP-binding protein